MRYAILRRALIFSLLLAAFALPQDSLSLAVAPVGDADDPKKSDEALLSELSSALGKYGFLKLVDRSKTKALLKEATLVEGGFIDAASAVKAGEIQGVQALAVASTGRKGLSGRIIHIQTARLIATASAPLGDMEGLAKKLASGVETFLARENLKKMRNDNPAIAFEFAVEKRKTADGGKGAPLLPGAEGRMKIGETIAFRFKADRDGWVTLVDIQPSGDLVILYPNDLSPDNKVVAGKSYAIPGPADTFEITVSEPVGRDTVVAFFTTAKVAWLDRSKLEGEGFKTVKEGERLMATRGLKLTSTGLKPEAWKSAVIEIDVER